MYGSKSPRERAMVDKFLERTLAYDSLMVDVVSRHGFALVDGSQSSVVGQLDGLTCLPSGEESCPFS